MGKIAKLIGVICLLCSLLTGCAAGAAGTETKKTETSAQKTAAAAETVLPQGTLRIKLLDVGHGDCILIQGEGKTILIDTGDPQHNQTVVQKLRASGVKKLDALIISHYHSDHNGGMRTVLNNFHPAMIYDAGVVNQQSKFVKNIFADYAAGRLKHTQLRRRQELKFSDGFYFQVISPGTSVFRNKKGSGHYLNNNSLVLLLHFGKFTMMFTGDMEAEAEHQALDTLGAAQLHADVLKTAHHGSRTSSTWDWLRAVKPTWAVISCGGDPQKYQHPNSKVVSTYEHLGIKIMTTKQNGDITITSDGKTYQVQGKRGEQHD